MYQIRFGSFALAATITVTQSVTKMTHMTLRIAKWQQPNLSKVSYVSLKCHRQTTIYSMLVFSIPLYIVVVTDMTDMTLYYNYPKVHTCI